MSKIGKKNIIIPKETTIKVEGEKILVSGPKGSKTLFIKEINQNQNHRSKMFMKTD